MTELSVRPAACLGSRIHRLSIRARSEFAAAYSRARPHRLGILGCYNTSNVGDLALGYAVLREALLTEPSAGMYSYSALERSGKPGLAVAGGGGILTVHPTSPLRKIARYNHGSGAVGALLGLSGSIREEDLDAELLDLLQTVPFISLRSRNDVAALRPILSRPDILYYPDLAFALGAPDEADSSSRSEQRVLGINVCPQLMSWNGRRFQPERAPTSWFCTHCADEVPFYSEIGPAYVSVMRTVVRTYIDEGWNVVAIPFACEDDLFARAVFRDMPIRFQSYRPSPDAVLASVQRCDALIATRFHAHVFGILARTPLLSVAYSRKVEDLWIDLGLPRSSVIRRREMATDPDQAIATLGSGQFVILSGADRDHVVEEARAGIRLGLTTAMSAYPVGP